jgi:hypothetical protein
MTVAIIKGLILVDNVRCACVLEDVICDLLMPPWPLLVVIFGYGLISL